MDAGSLSHNGMKSGKKIPGVRPGILLTGLNLLGNKQNRTALLLAQLMADSVHTSITSALTFQPARSAALNLTRHAPACDFISTPSHTTLFACQNSRRIIEISPLTPSPMT